MRGMEFRKIAICDIAATMSGGLLGILVAVAGGNYWSVVVQILTTDIVYLLVLQFFGAAYRPNLHLRLLRQIAGFSLRAFAAGLLTSISHNVDNLLVGRFHGPQALAFYAMAYKLLLLPVQLAHQIDRIPLQLRIHAGRASHIQDGIALIAQADA